MSHADFVHLRVHTPYSLSEGAIKVADLVKLCVDGAMPAVAVTDTNNLFGALEFAMAAAAEGGTADRRLPARGGADGGGCRGPARTAA